MVLLDEALAPASRVLDLSMHVRFPWEPQSHLTLHLRDATALGQSPQSKPGLILEPSPPSTPQPARPR